MRFNPGDLLLIEKQNYPKFVIDGTLTNIITFTCPFYMLILSIDSAGEYITMANVNGINYECYLSDRIYKTFKVTKYSGVK